MNTINYQGSVIYQILNVKNGHCYIGSALTFYYRQHDHIHRLKKRKHHSRYLQRAWNRYGAKSFEFVILELVPDKHELLKREQYWMDTLHPAYNMDKVAGSPIGRKLTCAQKEAQRKRMAGKNSWNYGKKLSQETKEKIRASAMDRGLSPERIKQMHLAMARRAKKVGWPRPMLGKHHSPESCKKMSINNAGSGNPFFGKTHSKKTRKVLSQNWKIQIATKGHPRLGTKHSAETREKMSEMRKGKPGPVFSEEAKRLLSEQKRGPLNPNYRHGNNSKYALN